MKNFFHCAIALHAEGFIEFAGVKTLAQTGGAFAAVGVGVNGDVVASLEFVGHVGAGFDDGGGDFVAGDARIAHQWILAAKRAEICAAEADDARLEKNFANRREVEAAIPGCEFCRVR